MDRLYVSYEKYRRMIAEKKILHRLVQGVRILTVALACYGWWGVIYPELTMLPSTYEIVLRGDGSHGGRDCTDRSGSGRMEFRQPDLLEDSGGGSGADPVQEQTAYDVKKIKGEIPCIRRMLLR